MPRTHLNRNAVRATLGVLLGVALCVGVSCRTPAPLPPFDLSTADWKVLQGQAVWKPPHSRLEIAGDLLIATRPGGDMLVQFSKTPFPLVTARVSGGVWEIEFGTEQRHWRAPGRPPSRFGWFQLPEALAAGAARGDWRFEGQGASWKFSNPKTGEELEGELSP